VALLTVVCVWWPARGAGAEAEQARRILSATGVRGGLVVHLGCGEGKLTAALGAGDGFLVHGLDADGADVAAARAHIRSLGLYGKVSAERWVGKRLPYAENLVRLLVADGPGGVAESEAMRVLCPGGVAYVREGGAWKKTVKQRPPQMDEWTHFRHSAGGNMVSRDRLIGPPRHVQWVCGPRFQRHHGIVPTLTTVVSAGGRVFYSIDESPMGLSGMPDQWKLLARDAFSGVLLWKRPMPDWGSRAWSYWTEGHSARFNHPLHVRKRLVASGDRVYVTLGFNAPLCALDAATGRTVMTYEGTRYTDEFVLSGGVLYLAVNDRPQKPWPGEGVQPAPPTKPPAPSRKHIRAVEAATGKVLWKAGPFVGSAGKPDRLGSMHHLNLTAAAGGVFLIDQREVVCLDAATGRRRWRIDRLGQSAPPAGGHTIGTYYHALNGRNLHAMICHGDAVYILHPPEFRGISWPKDRAGILQAVSVATGKELWRHEEAVPIAYLDHPDIFGIGDCVWVPDRKTMSLIALDAVTGKVRRTLSIRKALNVGHHHRCYPNRASQDYIILGRRGAEFVDLATGGLTLHHWARSGCRCGHMLANGLLYRLPDHCRCYMAFQPRGFMAMASEKAAAGFDACLDDADPLEKGPAYGKGAAKEADYGAEWPTFRHDAMRSGMATTDVPASVEPIWQAAVGGEPTSPVVAGGKVFVCTPGDHQVHALEAATGARAWAFTAGGPVDSPPTIHAGLAVFGCRDGRVYCLRAGDGELVWRFRAARGRRRIVAFGQLESAWPVAGSVLAAGRTVYFVAGRASVLDGGVTAYALDLRTGKLLDRRRLGDVQTETKTTGQLPQGALADILTTDGEAVYLRNRRLELSAPVGDVGPADLAALRPQLSAEGGFLNKRWFHRAFWSYRARGIRAGGNLVAFDPRRAYVAAANAAGRNNQSFHIPAGGDRERVIGTDGKGPSWCANPNLQIGGCLLLALEPKSTGGKTAPAAGEAPVGRKGKRARKNRTARPPVAARWRIKQFPLVPWAMVVSGRSAGAAGGTKLFVAGFADRAEQDDPWAHFEARRGGVLYTLSAADGSKLAECALESPPVWNGMAAAGGRLYLAARNGRLICLGGK